MKFSQETHKSNEIHFIFFRMNESNVGWTVNWVCWLNLLCYQHKLSSSIELVRDSDPRHQWGVRTLKASTDQDTMTETSDQRSRWIVGRNYTKTPIFGRSQKHSTTLVERTMYGQTYSNDVQNHQCTTTKSTNNSSLSRLQRILSFGDANSCLLMTRQLRVVAMPLLVACTALPSADSEAFLHRIRSAKMRLTGSKLVA